MSGSDRRDRRVWAVRFNYLAPTTGRWFLEKALVHAAADEVLSVLERRYGKGWVRVVSIEVDDRPRVLERIL